MIDFLNEPNNAQMSNSGIATTMAESRQGNQTPFIPLSPPKCEVDDTPLHGKSLNKNKESLKVKLMLRRPRQDLVSRGVIPAVSTSYNFYEQRQRLDMAKKHDILKHKMQRRPLREELIRQHILEDSPNNMDPSLVEKQKQLKRAKIADAISDHLCQRPGPLELVKANILHTSEDLEKAVKEGQLVFKSTSEGEPRKHPNYYINPEDESSSESALSPEQSEGESGRASRESSVAPITISTIPASSIQFSTIQSPASVSSIIFSAAPSVSSLPLTLIQSNQDATRSPNSTTSSMSPLSAISPPQMIQTSQPNCLAQALLVTQTTLPQALKTPPLQNSAPGKDQSKSRKKSKGKSQPKTRTIKFHEYKGPPTAAKKDATPAETSYDILLQQQQLFLQCQLELKQKYPQIILPADMKPTVSDGNMTLSSVLGLAQSSNSSTTLTPIAPAPSNGPVPPAPPPPPPKHASMTRLPVKLEEMKVSDLKAELKKRNLPVSGSKPSLIERLKCSTKVGNVTKPNFSYGSNANGPKTPERNETKRESESIFSSRASIDCTDESSVSGMLEASMEIGDESIASPAYSQISTRPSSVAPMDVDFESTMDGANPPTPDVSSQISDSIDVGHKVNLSQFVIANGQGEGIVQLQKKINDLERKLHDTQMQLHLQQQHNMLKAKELYQQNNNESKRLSPKDIIQHQLENRKQLQQQKQLQSHMQQLQQNLQKEQKQLVKNVLDEHSNGLEELLILHPQSMAVRQSPPHNVHTVVTERPQNVHTIVTEHPHEEQQITIRHNVPPVNMGDVQVKVEGWSTSMPVSTSIPVRSNRSSSVAMPNAINTHHRTSSLPSFSGSTSTGTNTLSNVVNTINNNNITCGQPVSKGPNSMAKPPPNYSEATRTCKAHQINQYPKATYESQLVDDVLEILIKNGELPPSAAANSPQVNLGHHVPPPPPPPPPKSVHQKISSQSSHLNSVSSPSVFADLVLGTNSPASMDLGIDLDLPVLELNLEHQSEPKQDSKMEVEDLDVASWIDSLTRTSLPWIPIDQASTSGLVNGVRSCSSASSSASSSGYGSNFHQSDPLLGSNNDQLDYFCIEDIDLKNSNQNDLSWDRLDFPA